MNMCRFVFLFLLLGLSLCQTIHAQSPKQNTVVCDNKYRLVTETISYAELHYGTLYSGGIHFAEIDNVGHTIDVYRRLSGLDLAYGKRFGFNYYQDFSFPAFVNQEPEVLETQIKTALTTMTAPKVNQMINREATARALDIATTSHPAIDWWLRVDDFELADPRNDEIPYYFRRDNRKISPLQITVSKLARTHPELDWLQAALAISTVPYPWDIKPGDTPSPELANVMRHISRQALNAENPLPWIAVLELNLAYDYALPARLKAKLAELETRIQACEASPAEYGALLANHVPLPPNRLEPGARNRQYRYEMKRYLVARNMKFDSEFFDHAMTLSEDMNVAPSLFGGTLLSASTQQELDSFMTSRHRRWPLSVLSRVKSDYLAKHYPGAAFTRMFSLGRLEDARKILDTNLDKNPKLKADLNDIMTADIDENLRLALIILRQKCLTHQLYNFCDMDRFNQHTHRDLNTFKPAENFLIDTLYCQDEPLIGYRGYGRQVAAISERYVRRGLSAGPAVTRMRHGQDCIIGRTSDVLGDHVPTGSRFPLEALFDTEETDALTGEKRLTRTLSLAVIAAARDKSRSKSSDPFLAEALHRVVWMNKHEDGGDIEDIPVGQRAFKILHVLFSESEWAEKTPYWWPPRRRP